MLDSLFISASVSHIYMTMQNEISIARLDVNIACMDVGKEREQDAQAGFHASMSASLR